MSSQSLPGSGPPVLLNKPGLNVDDGGGIQVPDPTGAIGPNHYVEMVNSAIAVYDRDNLNLVSKALLTPEFFTFPSGFAGQDFFDPQIKWDEQGQRWLYAGLGPQVSQPPGQYTLVFGWSKTADPSDVDARDGSSGWCRYVLTPPPPPMHPSGGNQLQRDDYPKLGYSANHIIIGTNIRLNLQELHQSRLWTIPKPAPGVTTCPDTPTASMFGDPARGTPLKTADGDNAFTPVPASTIESTDKGYIVAADHASGAATASQIMVWHIEGSPGSPVLVPDGNIDVPSYAQAPVVPQPGVPDVLNVPSMSPRLTAAVMASDPDAAGAKAIWTQHAVNGPGARSEARWYELVPGMTLPRQNGAIASSLHHVFNPAISPTKKGNEAVINYNLGSGTQVAQIAVRSRRHDTPLNEMSGETIIGTSDASVTCQNNTPPFTGLCNWGDYAGASPDPKNAHAVWGSNELIGPATKEENWTSRNFAVSTLKTRLATLEDNIIVHPTTGFDTAIGQVSITSSVPTPYEGTKQLRAVYLPSTGNALGRFTESFPNGSDVWYGAAVYLDAGFKLSNGNVALIQWEDPVTGVHGGVSLRTDDLYHVVRGSTSNPSNDTNVGPAFSLPEGSYFWLEVHQRLDQVSPLTEVFLNGRLISTSAAQNTFADAAGVPSRISYGVARTGGGATQVHVDRASLHPLQRGALGAPAMPAGFNGSGQDQTAILFWNSVPGATGYRVYKQNADGTWSQRFDVTTTGVFEPGLTNCTTYRYRVSAYNAANVESVVSLPLAITPKAANQTC